MKYLVNAGLQGSAFLGEFEASSEEEAIAKAEASAFLGLCSECSKLAQNLEIVFLTADIQNCDDHRCHRKRGDKTEPIPKTLPSCDCAQRDRAR